MSGAKAGGRQILATATEEGEVGLINASEDAQFDRDHGRTSLPVHRNAIFDLAWSKDDQYLVRYFALALPPLARKN